MTPALPASFLDRPIAHRGLHGPGVPENSLTAFRAAIAAGYGIELDLQLSADGKAMVFHDYDLARLTGDSGALRQRSADALRAVSLTGGAEGIPTFAETLSLVDGRVPLLVEIKDQDGALGPGVGTLEAAAARALDGYSGDVALMSFNPHSVAACRDHAPLIPRGLVTDAFRAEDWPTIPGPRRDALRDLTEAARVGARFISHDARDLDNPRVAALRAEGLAILCWTVRSPEEEAAARLVAQNVTFEGYAA